MTAGSAVHRPQPSLDDPDPAMSTLPIDHVLRDGGGDHLIVVPTSASVHDAVALMAARDVGAVVVMAEDDLFAGIFTERDLLKRVVHAQLDPRNTPVSEVMSRDVQFVSGSTPVEAALALLHVNRYRHLLVMDGQQVRGVVSMRDLAYALLRQGTGRLEAAVRAARHQADGGI